VKTYSDLLRHEDGGRRDRSWTGSYVYPRALNALLGTRFKLITGLPRARMHFSPSSAGELDGTCESLDSIVARRPDWIRSGKRL